MTLNRFFPLIVFLTVVGAVYQGYRFWRGEHFLSSGNPVLLVACGLVLLLLILALNKLLPTKKP